MNRPVLRLFTPCVPLLLILGCRDQFTSMCTTRVNLGTPLPSLIALAGRATQVSVVLPLPFSCPTGTPQAERVETEVFEPSNLPLAHTATPPISSGTAGYTTFIVFTPAVPGNYYVSARFEPSIGAAHRDVTAVRDRTADGPFVSEVSVPAGCEPVAVTAQLVICRIGSTAVIIRPAEAGARFPITSASEVMFAAPSLWVWGGDTLSRYEDPGSGGFSLRETVITATGALHSSAVAATSRDIVFLREKTAHRFSVSGQTLTHDEIALVGLEINDALVSKAVRLGDNHYGAGVARSAVCDVILDGKTPATCTATSATAFAPAAGGLWAKLDTGLAFYSFAGTLRGPVAATLAKSAVADAVVQFKPLPLFELDQLVLVPHLPELNLEAFARGAGVTKPVSGSLENVLWQISPETGSLNAFAR